MAEANVYLIMLVRSGVGSDTQWFTYKVDYFAAPTKVEWDRDTMSVVLPYADADHLLRNGYARRMTDEEIDRYTAPPPPAAEKKPTAKKGDKS